MIGFRPLTEGDLPLLGEWFDREHVRRWWRDSTVEEHLPSVRGETPDEHYVILLDGRPIGMIQTYLAADFPEWDVFADDVAGVAGVDLLIGEPALIGRGLGPRLLDTFVREIVFARPGTRACAATVEEANRRSWRAFEKAGFRHLRDVEEDGLPHRLMWRDRGYAQP